MKLIWHLIILLELLAYSGCKTDNSQKLILNVRVPQIDPDYSGVTIPPNIAPLNFMIKEEGDFFKVHATSSSGSYRFSLKSSDGLVSFPQKSWRKLLDQSRGGKIKIEVTSYIKADQAPNKFESIDISVANEQIDPYLVYRLLYPGYHSWYKMKIVQRSLVNFRESSVIKNQIIGNDCVNCHSFSNNDPGKFLVHIRGGNGGTYFVEDNQITRNNLKTGNMPGGATYPAWHPNGQFVVFSSNNVTQSFYAHPDKNIEVYDHMSALVLYDIRSNQIYYIKENDDGLTNLQTFPSWSPDGKYLYFCQTLKTEENVDPQNIKNIHYSLARKAFDAQTLSFSETEIVFDASEKKKSVSFPRISPDGKHLVFTLHDFGTFPIWHKEADLYLLILNSGEYRKMDINSDDAESYHSWSSNGKWLVFSSKRGDGQSARPYFAYFGSPDSIGKPFVLPQKNPALYNTMLRTFNIPEFTIGKINYGPGDFAGASDESVINAIMSNPEDIPAKLKKAIQKEPAGTEWKLHE